MIRKLNIVQNVDENRIVTRAKAYNFYKPRICTEKAVKNPMARVPGALLNLVRASLNKLKGARRTL